MDDLWQPDPRLVRTIKAPSGSTYTLRLDGVAHGLAKEVESLLATLPTDDAAASWLRDELRVAINALRLGITFAHADERYAALGFCRLVIESAIRFAWLVAEGPVENQVRTRLGRLEKRDLQQLLDASKAIDDLTQLGPLVENGDELREHLGDLREPAAPDPRTMAREAEWEWLYALHRLCSAALHPGLGARAQMWDAVRTDGLVQILHWAFSGAASAANGLAVALFDSEPTLLKTNALVFANAGLPPPDDGSSQDARTPRS